MIVDRYASHGLRFNPFAVFCTASDSNATFVDRGLPAPPPPASTTLVQVIGEKGAGKTTQVLQWQSRAPGPYHYVPAAPYRDRWATPPVEQLVYTDEIDRMPAPLRARWFRQLAAAEATVVAGTHVDLAMPARRAGLTVVTHRIGPADLATVRAVLVGKVSRASDGTTKSFALSDAEIAAVHQRCGGSLRAAEILAHEIVAQHVNGSVALHTMSPMKVTM